MRANETGNSSPWISVGELVQGITKSNKLPPTGDFVGKGLYLYFENGRIIECKFKTRSELLWRDVSLTKKRRWTKETYYSTNIREGIYFLDFVKHLERATAISLVLDLNIGILTAVVGRLPTRNEAKQNLLNRALAGKELTGVEATFLSGSINKPFNSTRTPRHNKTDELVGKRVEYTYSPTTLYEHIYLNEGFYTWHCLSGAEKGLADTDRCHYYKIADSLYLFVWREKIIPTLGVLVEDFNQMRTSGKLFGYRGNDFGELCNFTSGGRARILD